MKTDAAIAVVGTFDSKAEEHTFLKERIAQRDLRTLTMNVGTNAPSPVPVNLDLFESITKDANFAAEGRDHAINIMLRDATVEIITLGTPRGSSRMMVAQTWVPVPPPADMIPLTFPS